MFVWQSVWRVSVADRCSYCATSWHDWHQKRSACREITHDDSAADCRSSSSINRTERLSPGHQPPPLLLLLVVTIMTMSWARPAARSDNELPAAFNRIPCLLCDAWFRFIQLLMYFVSSLCERQQACKRTKSEQEARQSQRNRATLRIYSYVNFVWRLSTIFCETMVILFCPRQWRLGLCESSFLILEYSVELFVDYTVLDWYRK